MYGAKRQKAIALGVVIVVVAVVGTQSIAKTAASRNVLVNETMTGWVFCVCLGRCCCYFSLSLCRVQFSIFCVLFSVFLPLLLYLFFIFFCCPNSTSHKRCTVYTQQSNGKRQTGRAYIYYKILFYVCIKHRGYIVCVWKDIWLVCAMSMSDGGNGKKWKKEWGDMNVWVFIFRFSFFFLLFSSFSRCVLSNDVVLFFFSCCLLPFSTILVVVHKNSNERRVSFWHFSCRCVWRMWVLCFFFVRFHSSSKIVDMLCDRYVWW